MAGKAGNGWEWQGIAGNAREWPGMACGWLGMVYNFKYEYEYKYDNPTSNTIPPQQTSCKGYKAQSDCALRFFNMQIIKVWKSNNKMNKSIKIYKKQEILINSFFIQCVLKYAKITIIIRLLWFLYSIQHTLGWAR